MGHFTEHKNGGKIALIVLIFLGAFAISTWQLNKEPKAQAATENCESYYTAHVNEFATEVGITSNFYGIRYLTCREHNKR